MTKFSKWIQEIMFWIILPLTPKENKNTVTDYQIFSFQAMKLT